MSNLEQIKLDINSLTTNNKELINNVRDYLNGLHNKKPSNEEFTTYNTVKAKIGNLTLLKEILES